MMMSFDKVALLVRIDMERGLRFRDATTEDRPVIEACVRDGWIISDEESGYVLTIVGMERLAGFRALFARVDDQD